MGVGDGQGGLACCDSWGCKESDTTERLNWIELKGIWGGNFSAVQWLGLHASLLQKEKRKKKFGLKKIHNIASKLASMRCVNINKGRYQSKDRLSQFSYYFWRTCKAWNIHIWSIDQSRYIFSLIKKIYLFWFSQ